jgi:hypothetical protein
MVRGTPTLPGAAGRKATARPSAHPKVLYRELNTGCVLYHPETNEAHVLNLTAAYIWSCCDGERDEDAMARELAQLCALPLGQARQDVKSALRDFHAKQLIL